MCDVRWRQRRLLAKRMGGAMPGWLATGLASTMQTPPLALTEPHSERAGLALAKPAAWVRQNCLPLTTAAVITGR